MSFLHRRDVFVGLAACATGASLAVAAMWYMQQAQVKASRGRKKLDSRSYTLDSGLDEKALTTTTVKPPFPTEIQNLLRSSSLCYLSTACVKPDDVDAQPHLSLMNFTYFQKEELIIMTTRRDTRKLTNLIVNPSIALLLHDFPQERTEVR